MTDNQPLKNEIVHTPKEAAYLLRVSEKTIYRWIQVGEMEAVRIGKKLLQIPHAEVLRFKGAG